MTEANRQTLVHAADLIQAFARDIRSSNTIDGHWSPEDSAAKAEHDDMIETANALRNIAQP